MLGSSLLFPLVTLSDAVAMLHNFNWDRVIFESDYMQLIRACRGEIVLAEVKHIVEDIKDWRKHHRIQGFTWTSRPGNQVAHNIASLLAK